MNKQKSLSERVVALSLMEEGTQAKPGPITKPEGVEEQPAARPAAFGDARELDDLPEEGKHLLVMASERMTRLEMADLLARHGIKTSASTLQRRLKKWRMEEAVALGEELKEAAEKLAAGGRDPAMREGALAAARQKVLEVTLSCNSRKESLQIYEALAGEEERLKRLELEEKKAQMQERALELQERRLRIAAGRNGAELFLEALRILGEEGVDDRAKVERARATLERWRAGVVIDVEGETAMGPGLEAQAKKMIGEGGTGVPGN